MKFIPFDSRVYLLGHEKDGHHMLYFEGNKLQIYGSYGPALVKLRELEQDTRLNQKIKWEIYTVDIRTDKQRENKNLEIVKQ